MFSVFWKSFFIMRKPIDVFCVNSNDRCPLPSSSHQLAPTTYMAPTSFDVIKGVGQSSSTEAGPSKVDCITINLPKELRAQSEILIFLRDHPVRS